MDRQIPKEEIRKRKRKTMLKAGGCVAAVLLLIYGIMMLAEPSVEMKNLKVSVADKGTINSTISATGKVVPAFEEIVNSPISTRIVEVYCKAGDSVAAGTPLLRLDLENAENELEKMLDEIAMKRHQLEQQRATSATQLSDLDMQIKVKAMAVDRMAVELRNERYLDSLGSGTGDKVRQVELAYRTGLLELEQMRERLKNERRVADANLQVCNLQVNISDKNLTQMRRTLDDARIRAPRGATLTYINDQVGQKVAEGEKLAIVADLSHFKVDAEIADAYAERLAVGSRAVVKIGSNELEGMVTNVAPQSVNGVIRFSVRLENDSHPRLRSGLKTDVYVLSDVIEDVVRIGNGSYYSGAADYELFVLDGDDHLERRKVRLGESNYEYVEVVEGLKPGDRVVTSDMSEYKQRNSLKIK